MKTHLFGLAAFAALHPTAPAATVYSGSSAYMPDAWASEHHISPSAEAGKFILNNSGILAFEFTKVADPTIHYGWLRLVPANDSVTVIDWAYEDTPGQAIQAGIIPKPGHWASLQRSCWERWPSADAPNRHSWRPPPEAYLISHLIQWEEMPMRSRFAERGPLLSISHRRSGSCPVCVAQACFTSTHCLVRADSRTASQTYCVPSA
jgi:hypothetical protein